MVDHPSSFEHITDLRNRIWTRAMFAVLIPDTHVSRQESAALSNQDYFISHSKCSHLGLLFWIRKEICTLFSLLGFHWVQVLSSDSLIGNLWTVRISTATYVSLMVSKAIKSNFRWNLFGHWNRCSLRLTTTTSLIELYALLNDYDHHSSVIFFHPFAKEILCLKIESYYAVWFEARLRHHSCGN